MQISLAGDSVAPENFMDVNGYQNTQYIATFRSLNVTKLDASYGIFVSSLSFQV